jgi:hypothetical protein
MSAPVTIAVATEILAKVTDNGTVQSYPGLASLAASGTTITLYKTLAAGAFTNSGNKACSFQGFYQI